MIAIIFSLDFFLKYVPPNKIIQNIKIYHVFTANVKYFSKKFYFQYSCLTKFYIKEILSFTYSLLYDLCKFYINS